MLNIWSNTTYTTTRYHNAIHALHFQNQGIRGDARRLFILLKHFLINDYKVLQSSSDVT